MNAKQRKLKKLAIILLAVIAILAISIPVFAASALGIDAAKDASTTASSGMIAGLEILSFVMVSSSVITAPPVISEPVPLVVGMAISGSGRSTAAVGNVCGFTSVYRSASG